MYILQGLTWCFCLIFYECLSCINLNIIFLEKFNLKRTFINLIEQDNFGTDLAAVQAATKKHEAIETDVNACKKRVEAVVDVAAELERENYHDITRINDR